MCATFTFTHLLNLIFCDQANDAGEEDDLWVILTEIRYYGLDGLTGG